MSLTLSAWDSEGHRVTILNCFTRSRYAPYADVEGVHENDRTSYVRAFRKKEDDVFRRGFRHLDVVDLNLRDAAIRLQCGADEVCSQRLDEADPMLQRIRTAAAMQMAAGGAQCVVMPLGIGGDIDHLLVREAGILLAAEAAIVCYEDLPYAARGDAGEAIEPTVASVAARAGQSLSPVLMAVPGGATKKMAQVVTYPSQINDDEAALIADYANRYGGGERIWVSERWREAAEADPVASGRRGKEGTGRAPGGAMS